MTGADDRATLAGTVTSGNRLPPNLPRVPREILRFRPHQAVLFDSLVGLQRLTGAWTHGADACGDVAKMTFWDKVYWLYKSGSPVVHARRGSGLEEFFRQQPACTLPSGFVVEKRVRISSVGDLMGHAFLRASGETLYRDVGDLVLGADIAMANLECVVQKRAEPAFEMTMDKGPPLYFDEDEFDVVSGGPYRRYAFMATACNHSLDFGADGVESTRANLDRLAIASHGINVSKETSDSAAVCDRNGIRVGIVSFTFGFNARSPPTEKPWMVNRMDLNADPAVVDFSPIQRQLEWCRKNAIDLVVAHLHWGFEYELYPTPAQVKLAHHVAELGVDVVIGHHPHTPQPYEIYTTARDPCRQVPIFYSLGNLVNPFSAPWLVKSMLARMEVSSGQFIDGRRATYVSKVSASEIEQTVDMQKERIHLRAL